MVEHVVQRHLDERAVTVHLHRFLRGARERGGRRLQRTLLLLQCAKQVCWAPGEQRPRLAANNNLIFKQLPGQSRPQPQPARKQVPGLLCNLDQARDVPYTLYR